MRAGNSPTVGVEPVDYTRLWRELTTARLPSRKVLFEVMGATAMRRTCKRSEMWKSGSSAAHGHMLAVLARLHVLVATGRAEQGLVYELEAAMVWVNRCTYGTHRRTLSRAESFDTAPVLTAGGCSIDGDLW